MSESTRATRLLAGSALAGVSLIAAVVSYLHGLAVVQGVGARPPVSFLIPFLADLVILGATTALLDAAKLGQRMSLLTVLSLMAGVGVTLAMNVAAGLGHGTAGALVAGWPAVAFILALESLAGMVRRGRAATVPDVAPATPDACPHGVARSAEEGVRIAFEHGRDCLGSAPSYRQLAASFGVDRNKVPKLLGTAAKESSAPPRPPVVPAAADDADATDAGGAVHRSPGQPPRLPEDAPAAGSPLDAASIRPRAPGADGAVEPAMATAAAAPLARSNGHRRG